MKTMWVVLRSAVSLRAVFMFPNDRAAEIAVQTVQEYKAETGSKIEVVFNVFKEQDEEYTGNCSVQIERLKQALETADAVLIGAGAGLSTSAGLTYSGERFERYFSDFHQKYRITDMYSGGVLSL